MNTAGIGVPILLSCSLVYGSEVAPKDPKVTINNDVNECITVIPEKVRVVEGKLLLDTSWKANKVTGDCGCKSALLAYHVSVEKDQRQYELLYTHFSSLHNKFTFLINADTSYGSYDRYILDISCKNPD
ncbi:DUF2195 family protein [Zooshikella ganghwensis]|uniref:DUF2195 family protein n=1 Tax=Zooshikella ganghwensis TaxID=202772 RepID=UPI000424EF15|nr:DUF2195 family protein [Zooshikella ganghwensis]